MSISVGECPFSREKFKEYLDGHIKNVNPSHIRYTYIASSSKAHIYKIGMSRNPLIRGFAAHKGYCQLDLHIQYFFEGDIERELLSAIEYAGATRAIPSTSDGEYKEAFFLMPDDVQYIVSTCGFLPISEFDAARFKALADTESEAYSHGKSYLKPRLSSHDLREMDIGERCFLRLESKNAIMTAKNIISYVSKRNAMKFTTKANLFKNTLEITRLS